MEQIITVDNLLIDIDAVFMSIVILLFMVCAVGACSIDGGETWGE
tara:strand:- start:22 stop:156 length:135 start_codon:yes stop_codon:yes gene_type:complete